jgi:hypothetical protein
VISREATEFARLSKVEVIALADELKSGAAEAIETAVRFVCAETEGMWHGRGRAMMCRRLKHFQLPGEHRDRLVEIILGRLESGHFSEQFRDQLRLALYLDRPGALAAATRSLASGREYVRRHARWVLSRP